MSSDSDDYSEYAKNSGEFTWVMVVYGLISVIDCILVFGGIYGFHKEPNPILSIDNKIFKRLTIIALLVSSFACWLNFISWYYALIGKPSLSININTIAACCYVVNMTLVIIIFGIRLIYTFKNTKYNMKNGFKCWIISFTIIVIVLTVSSILLFVIGNTLASSLVAGLMLMVSVISGIVLLVIYLRKLHDIISDFLEKFGGLDSGSLHELNRQLSEAYAAGQTEIVNPDFVNVDNSKTKDNNDGIRQCSNERSRSNEMFNLNRLVSDMTRFSILICVAMCSTMFQTVILVLYGFSGLLDIYIFFFTLTDLLINNICLILQFKMARKYYKKFCFCFINKCQSRQVNKINKSLDEMNLLSKMSLKRLPTGEIGFEILIDKKNQSSTPIDGNYTNSEALATLNSVQMHSDETQ